jgi:hypothetical protein
VINKVRALCSWYSKGLDEGSHLRSCVNSALSLGELREIVDEFFFADPSRADQAALSDSVGVRGASSLIA